MFYESQNNPQEEKQQRIWANLGLREQQAIHLRHKKAPIGVSGDNQRGLFPTVFNLPA